VSGRPLDITGIVPEAAGMVASWLPGSEGAGVADVLFGDKPFTGRLPETWALAESQLPINVGDANYNPLYAYGWGLRTDNPRSRLQTVRDQLEKVRGDAGAAAAVRALNAVLRAGNWNGDGSVRNAKQVLTGVQDTASALARSTKDSYAQDDLVVSVARDVAQTAIEASGPAGMPLTAKLTADAEHALLSGRPDQAVSLLAQAYHKVR
jgi:beta-glucosidase